MDPTEDSGADFLRDQPTSIPDIELDERRLHVLALSQLVMAFGFSIMYGPSGYVTLAVQTATGLTPWNLYTIAGMAVVAAICEAPLTFLYCLNSTRMADPALDAWFGKIKGKHKMVFDAPEPNNGLVAIWPRVYLNSMAATVNVAATLADPLLGLFGSGMCRLGHCSTSRLSGVAIATWAVSTPGAEATVTPCSTSQPRSWGCRVTAVSWR